MNKDNQASGPPAAPSLCPSCGQPDLKEVYQVRRVPVHSCLLLTSHQEALDFPRGDLTLAHCTACGFVTNTTFVPKQAVYAPGYEDQQSFSATFNQFASDLADHLIAKYDLHNKNIVEIGCGKGDFLHLLCERGGNQGVGIDPSVVPDRVHSTASERVRFVQAYYSERHAHYAADFICCRHTLEHIHTTADFLRTVRRAIGSRLNTGVFFEVPDASRILHDGAFEDIYYEHCSYFTPHSLAQLFRNCGFAVTDLYRAYGEQYLLLEARPVAEPSNRIHPLEESAEETSHAITTFAVQVRKKLAHWTQHLQNMQGKRLALWGSGSKAVAFLTSLACVDQISCVIDINPHRHGKFMPGVGCEIRPPEYLKHYAQNQQSRQSQQNQQNQQNRQNRQDQIDQIIVMNRLYEEEVRQQLTSLGVQSAVVSL